MWQLKRKIGAMTNHNQHNTDPNREKPRPVSRVIGTFVLLLTLATLIPRMATAQTPEAVTSEAVTFEQVAALDELTDDHARVFRLYWAFFDREPDAAGALYWVGRWDSCLNLESIAEFFVDGPEFQATYGDLSDEAFVDLVYANVLDRKAETEGRMFWQAELANSRMTRAEVMLHFAYSAEFVASHPLPSDGVPSRGCSGLLSPTGPRSLRFQNYEAFATVGGVTLYQPSVAVEQIGFHQSGNEGARQLTPVPSDATPMMTMESRARGTGTRTAADIAVHPGFEIRSPVTGTVIRAGGYVLYCKYRDDFVVIEPDDRPGWEVKVLHIDGVQVQTGDRVEAGVTVIAPTQTKFPFRSQIDAFTGEPSWGHVQIEVVDPSIPDRPSGRHC